MNSDRHAVLASGGAAMGAVLDRVVELRRQQAELQRLEIEALV